MIGSIVVGTDGSDDRKEAVRQATELAKTVNAKLHLVSAYEPVLGGPAAARSATRSPTT